MLTVKHLCKQYNDSHVVNDISFTLEKGLCTALLGPNGAGKTTTLRMLTGLIKPSSGTISYDSEKEDFRQLIGYLPQYPQYYDWMTAEEFLTYCSKLHGLSNKESIDRTRQLLQQVDLLDDKDKRISSYSGGMKQRLGLAQALIHEPKILFLDEPVASLDPIGRRDVLTLMERLKENMTILFSTHILNDADEISDSIILLKEGKIIEQGTIEALQKKYATGKIEIQLDSYPETIKEQLKQLQSVTSLIVQKNTFQLFVSDTTMAQDEILQFIVKEKLPLQKFQIGRLTLEEMFMKAVEK